MGRIRTRPPPVRSRDGGRDASPGAGAPAHTYRSDPSRKEASAWVPHGPSSRTGLEAEHDSEDPFLVEPFKFEWVGMSFCHTALEDVNVILLQHAPNLLSILRIHTSNTNAALNLTVTVLNDFELKRDTVQTENNLPAQ